MKRREFLTRTSQAALGFGLFSNELFIPQVVTEDTVEVQIPQAILVGGAVRVITWFLFRFAVRIAADVLANAVTDWVQNLDVSSQQQVNGMNHHMAQDGFTHYDHDTVFTRDNMAFYGVGHQDGLNVCTPFFVRNAWGQMQDGPVVEGPVVVGLSLAARDWPFTYGVDRADGLIPQQSLTSGTGQFEKSRTRSYICRTNVGYTYIDYKAYPWRRSGQLSVAAQQDDNQWLFWNNYRINWS